jgi:hypothetical protein
MFGELSYGSAKLHSAAVFLREASIQRIIA